MDCAVSNLRLDEDKVAVFVAAAKAIDKVKSTETSPQTASIVTKVIIRWDGLASGMPEF
jgi:hypothetical protein